MNLNKINNLRKNGLRIGITFSQFDLMHTGHVLMLSEAKNYCDFLICGIQNNAKLERSEKNSPIQSIIERQLSVSQNKCVDDIIIYNTEKDLENILMTLPLDVRIVGAEYIDKSFTGKDICIKKGIELIYNVRDHDFSSTSLRNRIIGIL